MALWLLHTHGLAYLVPGKKSPSGELVAWLGGRCFCVDILPHVYYGEGPGEERLTIPWNANCMCCLHESFSKVEKWDFDELLEQL